MKSRQPRCALDWQSTRPVDMALVDAQQARRILDRLVGYKLSPLLWKQIKRPWVRGRKPPALSAGRVQTVALRLVVEKDREIEAFIPEEYWTLDVELAASQATFKARLVQINGKEPGMLKQPAVKAVMEDLQSAAWQVGKVEHKEEKRYPYPPFTTSTLQQAASARLGWNPKKTMKVAQELFEGVTLAGEHVGLITYMRTDSVQVAAEAQAAARQTIQKYWPQALPDRPPVYRTKTANAQEAHEAIRPTDSARTPKPLREALSPDQAALYQIIWRRFIASQMKPAFYSVTTVDVPATGKSGQIHLFRSVGRTLLDLGFLAAYEVDEDDQEKESKLPDLQPGQALRFVKFLPEKHMHRASQTIFPGQSDPGVGEARSGPAQHLRQHRGSSAGKKVCGKQTRKGKTLISTEVGRQVLDFLLIGFADIFDYGFTARMEEQLDEIAGGQVKWQSVLDEFWQKLGPESGIKCASYTSPSLRR